MNDVLKNKIALRLLNAKTETLGHPAETWYSSSRKAIQTIYGKDWRLFAKCLAATSPNATLAANVTLARKAFNQIKDTGTIRRESFCRTHYRCLLCVCKGRIPNGRKVRAFYLALTGDENQVVIDVWMMRYAGYANKSPNNTQYALIADRITEEAEKLGRTPAAHQAVLWSTIRGAGESYDRYLLQYRLF